MGIRVLSLCFLLALPLPAPAAEVNPEAREALQQVDTFQNAHWAQCTEQNGAIHLITRVVPPQAARNGFAPGLQPPGPQEPGYYDLLYRSGNGQDKPGLQYGPTNLTAADRQNGIEARYTVRLTIPAFRIYDPQVKRWSEWNTGSGGATNKVNYVNFIVTKRFGAWSIEPRYNIMTNGIFELPRCNEVPR
jgi:hypothetical protein